MSKHNFKSRGSPQPPLRKGFLAKSRFGLLTSTKAAGLSCLSMAAKSALNWVSIALTSHSIAFLSTMCVPHVLTPKCCKRLKLGVSHQPGRLGQLWRDVHQGKIPIIIIIEAKVNAMLINQLIDKLSRKDQAHIVLRWWEIGMIISRLAPFLTTNWAKFKLLT